MGTITSSESAVVVAIKICGRAGMAARARISGAVQGNETYGRVVDWTGGQLGMAELRMMEELERDR